MGQGLRWGCLWRANSQLPYLALLSAAVAAAAAEVVGVGGGRGSEAVAGGCLGVAVIVG